MKQAAAVVREADCDIRAGKCQAAYGVGAMGEFGAFGFEELAPRRGVEIQVAHFDHGASHQGGGFGFMVDVGAGVAPQLPGLRRTAFAAGDGQAGDGGDRGERFTAKTEGGDVFEVV